MNMLTIYALILGAVMLVGNGLVLLKPEKMKSVLLAFPRHKISGWLLTAVTVCWAAWWIKQGVQGIFMPVKPFIYPLAPVFIVAICYLMDDLLAVRALGGFFILCSDPLMDAARYCESHWSILITVLTYILVIKGMLLVMGPYRMRLWVSWYFEKDSCRKMGSIVGLVLGVAVVTLALLVY